MNKKSGKKMGKFALWVFVIMIISFVISASIIAANDDLFRDEGVFTGFHYDDEDLKNAEKINDEETVDAFGIKNIEVDEVNADVNIIEHEGNEIKIHFHGSVRRSKNVEIPKLEVSYDKDSIKITVERIKKRFGLFTYTNENTKLDIYVPENYGDDIDIDVVSAEVSIEGFDLDNVKIKTVSGDVWLKNTAYEDVIIDTVSGEIFIEGDISDSDLETVSGDIYLTVSSFKDDIEMKTISGDVTLSIEAAVEGFKLEYSTVSGDLQNLLNGLEIRKKNDDDFIVTYGNEKYDITVNTVSGDISIR